jgi:tetratricopeptide (TPR) repeat protein
MLSSLLGVLRDAPEAAAATTELLKFRSEVSPHGEMTRIHLSLKGAHPQVVHPGMEGDLTLSFATLRSRLRSDPVIDHPSSAVTSVHIVEGGNAAQVRIGLRHPQSTVRWRFLPAASTGSRPYRLTIDVAPPRSPVAPEDTPAAAAARVLAGNASPVDETASEPAGAASALNTPDAATDDDEPQGSLDRADRALRKGDWSLAESLYTQVLDDPLAGPQEKSGALYGLADSHFLQFRDDLPSHFQMVLSAYARAMEADPAGARLPWALYRCGAVCENVGNYKKAADFLERVIKEFSSHPAASMSWIAVGKEHQRQKAHGEAIQAFRHALKGPLSPDVSATALWHLGESLYATGKHPQALEALERAIANDPALYQRVPLLLKYLGELYFVAQQLDKSCDYLLWYYNLTPELSDKDLILARIAEILTVQEDKALSNKLYAYIQNTFPDSEGDIIAQIRRTEYLESRQKIAPKEALAVYRELAQKRLPTPLIRLVQQKYALRQLEYGYPEECLQVIENTLQNDADEGSQGELLRLRARAIVDLLKKCHTQGEHARAVEIYEEEVRRHDLPRPLELELTVAESYAQLKLYSRAIQLCEQLLAANGGVPNEEVVLKIAEFHFLSGDADKAERLLLPIQLPSLQPKKVELLARIYHGQQHHDKVRERVRPFLDQAVAPPGGPEWCILVADSLMHVGDLNEALVWLQKVPSGGDHAGVAPEDSVHIYRLQSQCFAGLKQHDRAIAALEQAIVHARAEDARCRLYYDLAALYVETGRPQEAMQPLGKLLESPQSFWQTAAKLRIDNLHLRSP